MAMLSRKFNLPCKGRAPSPRGGGILISENPPSDETSETPFSKGGIKKILKFLL